MELLVATSGILTLISGAIGIYSTLRSHKLAGEKFELERQQGENTHRTSLIDDIQQVLDTVKEENGRLAHRVEELEITNRALVKANDHLVARMEIMEAAKLLTDEKNARLTERVEELEGDLARLYQYRADE